MKPTFNKAFQQLNPEQRSAVTTIDGPVLVNAGPGTGKTQILATRIGHILKETDTQPADILCLTYTDAGATAMRKRLIQFIGSDAHNISIHTFHGFCGRVMRENPSYFSIREQEPVSEWVQLEILHEIIDGFEKNHPLKKYKNAKYTDSKRLKSLFSTMKQEGWTPEFIEKQGKAYLEELPNREGFYYKRKYKQFEAGDPKPAKIAQETDKINRLIAGAKCLPAYQQKLQERGLYDFDDMIIQVNEAFKNEPNLLLSYQERFLYLLADEYQDTNGAQNQLLMQLADYWPEPNLFVVGDDDQSIYRFQGANLANMNTFIERYISPMPKEEQQQRIIVLQSNYRSTKPILQAAGSLIEQNNSRLVNETEWLRKDLTAFRKDAPQPKPIVMAYENTYMEGAAIAKHITTLIEEGVSPSEIGVIYRNHAQSEDLLHFLQAKEIPVDIKRNENIFDQNLIQNILFLLGYIDAERTIPLSGNHSLYQVLNTPFFNLEPIAVARASAFIRFTPNDNKKKAFAGWRSLLLTLAEEDNAFKPIASVVQSLENLLQKAITLPLQQFFDALLEEAGILSWVGQQPNRLELLQELNTFFDFIKAETARDKSMDLTKLLKLMDWMQSNGIRIPVRRFISADSGVQFMTAHGAKGLEFEYVFLMGCQDRKWNNKRSGGFNSFSFPDNLIPQTTSASKEEELEENRRLFYVAITRPKHHLFISYANQDANGKDLTEASFVSELIDKGAVEVQTGSCEKEWMDAFQMEVMQSSKKPKIDEIEKNMMRQYLDQLTLSVTAMNNYLECPLKFYYQNFLRVPAAKNEAMQFGSAMHYALQRYFEEMKKNNNTFLPKETILDYFEWGMKKSAEVFTEESFQDLLEKGKDDLLAYLNHYSEVLHPHVHLEKYVSSVFEDIPISGIFDKLELHDRSINVVDYKTGKHKTSKNTYKKFNRPGEKINARTPNYVATYGGDYWRQAVFYKILLSQDAAFRDYTVTSATFDFIEPDEKGEFHKEKIVITPEDVKEVKAQIRYVYKEVMAQSFEGCGEDNCKWCAFEANRAQRINLELEEID